MNCKIDTNTKCGKKQEEIIPWQDISSGGFVWRKHKKHRGEESREHTIIITDIINRDSQGVQDKKDLYDRERDTAQAEE